MKSRERAQHSAPVVISVPLQTGGRRTWQLSATVVVLALGLCCPSAWAGDSVGSATPEQVSSSCALVEPGGSVVRFENGERITPGGETPSVLQEGSPILQLPPDPLGGAARIADPVTATAQKVCADGTCAIELSWSGTSEPVTVVAASDVGFQDDVETLEHGYPSSSKLLETPHHDLFVDIVETGGDVVSRAVSGRGYEPLPQPRISSFTQQAWWGEDVVIAGDYLDAIAPVNLAAFGGRTRRAASVVADADGFATNATFTVPSDARGTYLQVQANGHTSAATTAFLAMIPAGIDPYGEVRGVVWAAETGKVWVAADGQIDEIDVFRRQPICTTVVSGLSKAYISRVSASSNEIVYIDGVSGVGEVRVIDPVTATDQHFAYTTDASFTRQMLPVGVGVAVDGSACFIADASSGHIVKIPRGNGSDITDGYGSYLTWSFPDPCGMDVADNGFLYAPTATAVRVVKSATNTEIDASVAGVHSIEIDRDASTSIRIRYFMARATGFAEAFNTNPIEYGTGPPPGESPPRYMGGLVFARIDGLLQLDPDWFFTFSQRSPQRILLTNAEPEWPYPSPYQSKDHIIEMQVEGWYGVKLQLELVDPPDLAPYDSKDLDDPLGFAEFPYHADDNAGETGAVYGLSLSPDGSSPTQELVVSPGSDDVATFYLRVPPDASGNNYQVQAVKYDSATNQPIADRVTSISPVYTTWKRVFVERKRMFRRGGLLARDYPNAACSNCSYIEVFKWSNVSPNDEIVIFDNARDFGSSGQEMAWVKEVTPGPGTSSVYVHLKDGPGDDASAFVPTGVYSASADQVTDPENPVLDFGVGTSPGIGVVSNCDAASNQINSASACFFDVDLRVVQRTFSDPLVELISPGSDVKAVPYYPGEEKGTPGRWEFSWRWFGHQNGENHVQAIGAIEISGSDGTVGITGRTDQSVPVRTSYVFVGRIEDIIRDQEPYCFVVQPPFEVIQDATIHELSHQFRTNTLTPDSGEHCFSEAWTGGGGCILHKLSSFHCPGIDPLRLDADSNSLTSANQGDLYDVRFEEDPLPLQF